MYVLELNPVPRHYRDEEVQSMNPARGFASGRGHLIRRILGAALMVFSALGLVISDVVGAVIG